MVAILGNFVNMDNVVKFGNNMGCYGIFNIIGSSMPILVTLAYRFSQMWIGIIFMFVFFHEKLQPYLPAWLVGS